MICVICGAEFEPTCSWQKYCNNDCKRRAKNMGNPERKKRCEIRGNMMVRQHKNKLNEVLRECQKQGVDYSEWKKQQALARVPRIEV